MKNNVHRSTKAEPVHQTWGVACESRSAEQNVSLKNWKMTGNDTHDGFEDKVRIDLELGAYIWGTFTMYR